MEDGWEPGWRRLGDGLNFGGTQGEGKTGKRGRREVGGNFTGRGMASGRGQEEKGKPGTGNHWKRRW